MRGLAALTLTLAGALASCSGGANDTTLTVFAASSLTNAFERIARAYEDANPDVRVRLSFAGSTALARQIRDGAPADVFAAADTESMEMIDASEHTFARNRLTIVVPAGNPKGVTAVSDLTRSGLVVVVCAPEVPCGRRTAELMQNTGVTIAPASREDSVRSVLTKVVAGEADAGIVYETDVRHGDRVEAVRIPDGVNVVSAYPIAALRGSRAQDFVSFVLSGGAQRVLREEGFLSP